jgi:lipoate-protein ligase A
MDNWRFLPLHIADQQEHIDHCEHLMSKVQSGDQALLYWYLAEPQGLVLGFSQKQAALTQPTPIPVYQRRAGGTAVLVGPSLLSLDVLLPAGHPLIERDLVESYRWFGEAWVTTLARLGVQTRAIPPAEAHAHRERLKDPATRDYEQLMNRACYGTLSSYEVVVGLRKVVGLCMIRRQAATLLQAGVLLNWETDLLAEMLGQTSAERELLRTGLRERAVGLDTLTGRQVSPQEIINTFEDVITNERVCLRERLPAQIDE